MKSTHIIGIVVILAVISAIAWVGFQSGGSPVQNNSSCYYGELNYYYRANCHYCQEVSKDGTLEKLQELGVRVNRFEVVQWGMYGIYSTPTFEFGGQRISGYHTFEQLKGLLGCKQNI